MTGAFNEIAATLTGGQVDALGLDWSRLRFQHMAAIRAKLAERDAPATANKKLSAPLGARGCASKFLSAVLFALRGHECPR